MSSADAGAADAGSRSLVAQWYNRNPARRAPEVDFGTRWTRADRADEWRGARAAQLLEQAQSALGAIADHGTLTETLGNTVDDESPCSPADGILRQWREMRSADVGSVPVSPPEELHR